MRESTSTVRRACALGTTAALVVLTTGLGIVTATAANADTAPTTTVTDAPTATATPDPTTAPTEPAASDPTSTPSPSATPTGEPTADPSTPAPTSDTTPAPTTTTTTTTLPRATLAAPQAPVVDPSVTITGDAKVGSSLAATWAGFDGDGAFKYVWTDKDTGAVVSKTMYYLVDATEAGKQVVVTVTGDKADGTGQATVESDPSAVITQDPVFVDESGKPMPETTQDEPLYLDTTAGDAFSYTFRAQGSPAPTYKLDWYWSDEADSADSIVASRSQADNTIAVGFQADDAGDESDFTPKDQLPEGITFDPSTGELSGTATLASFYDFAITATSGDVSTTQYVELTVDHAAAIGITAYTLDAKSITADKKRVWLIQPDGSIYTLDVKLDSDGFPSELTLTPSGRPTVAQGGTLVVQGSPVDRFGNDATDFDDDGNPTFTAKVTSDVASDVVKTYSEDGVEVDGVFAVTFPHASTHTLTVSSGALQPVSFAVDVQPTVAPAAVVVTPTATGRQLAYTGTDATGALPWAAGLVLAGVGLIGARAWRRRSAQR
ncbi:hypothetical protein Csp2054_08895 [Curtobacterium sp. 'Ferrero']|uniref:putative Ig domain-containing protein n=1 Tax=Curtobacterium sp. 'Ferrero' TaxID=2033654 RepID=UPI000BCF9F16|nr:putative Ig domain-containing protein [Curtobacterium sp. 'Ferrero']PCN47982.1 hypothetical protein Csp2054_08895 [Curtobacterium sp. 'Ferrero']